MTRRQLFSRAIAAPLMAAAGAKAGLVVGQEYTFSVGLPTKAYTILFKDGSYSNRIVADRQSFRWVSTFTKDGRQDVDFTELHLNGEIVASFPTEHIRTAMVVPYPLEYAPTVERTEPMNTIEGGAA